MGHLWRECLKYVFKWLRWYDRRKQIRREQVPLVSLGFLNGPRNVSLSVVGKFIPKRAFDVPIRIKYFGLPSGSQFLIHWGRQIHRYGERLSETICSYQRGLSQAQKKGPYFLSRSLFNSDIFRLPKSVLCESHIFFFFRRGTRWPRANIVRMKNECAGCAWVLFL